jgi:deoxyribodipyrimidine photo-lyase
MKERINIFWFRRDLRLEDNRGLSAALSSGLPVLPLFIFDRDILDELEEKSDRRVSFIHHHLHLLQDQLVKQGSSLETRHGAPLAVFEQLVQELNIGAVFTNHDYEPYARQRDRTISEMLRSKGIAFHTCKDQVIFEKNEIVKPDGSPYSVFTPYSKKWLSQLDNNLLQSSKTARENFFKKEPAPIPTLASLGFGPADGLSFLPRIDPSVIRHYDSTRNIPSIEGTSRLGVHLRFGTISIRRLVSQSLSLNSSFVNELIWREFFMQMLWHEPRLVHEAFKPGYDGIRWRNNEAEFERWCEGKTGYPIVDAGMRELNSTGFMHNRVRMITASFLVKHLLIDWRWGESWFAKKLNDYELSSNIGNWQWVAGCGCDAAPYFRIFSPAAQTRRFDAAGLYISRWVPEAGTGSYPAPIVGHEAARERCLNAYRSALAKVRD